MQILQPLRIATGQVALGGGHPRVDPATIAARLEPLVDLERIDLGRTCRGNDCNQPTCRQGRRQGLGIRQQAGLLREGKVHPDDSLFGLIRPQ
ncbi:hypothetical protein D3C76_1605720 [compost metagenome]